MFCGCGDVGPGLGLPVEQNLPAETNHDHDSAGADIDARTDAAGDVEIATVDSAPPDEGVDRFCEAGPPPTAGTLDRQAAVVDMSALGCRDSWFG